MNIVYVHPHQPWDWELHHWRCLSPAEAINRTRLHSASTLSLYEFIHFTSPAEQICSQADLLIIQHDLVGKTLTAIQHWKAKEKTVLVDIQKSPVEMNPDSPGYEQWLESLLDSGAIEDPNPTTDLITQFGWGLKLVHGATIPTPRLEKEWSSYPNLHHLPSFIDTELYSNVSRGSREGTVIGWAPAPSISQEEVSQNQAIEAILTLCREEPSLTLHCLNLDENIFDNLLISETQKVLTISHKQENWANQLASFDLGVLPLTGARHDHHRYVRTLEYMLMDIPWISNLPIFDHFQAEFGWVIPDQKQAWGNALSELIRGLTPHQRRGGRSAYLYSISQHIDDHVENMLSMYRSIRNGA